MARQTKDEKQTVHLYWNFDRPHLHAVLQSGIAMCGERGIPRKLLTCDTKKFDCKGCKAKLKENPDGLGIPEFLRRKQGESITANGAAGQAGSRPVKPEPRVPFEKPMGLTMAEYEALKVQFEPKATRAKDTADAPVRGDSRRVSGVPGSDVAGQGNPPQKPRHARVEGGRANQIVAMLRKPGGVTREEILAATGWRAVSVQQQARQAGVVLKVDKSRNPYRYSVE